VYNLEILHRRLCHTTVEVQHIGLCVYSMPQSQRQCSLCSTDFKVQTVYQCNSRVDNTIHCIKTLQSAEVLCPSRVSTNIQHKTTMTGVRHKKLRPVPCCRVLPPGKVNGQTQCHWSVYFESFMTLTMTAVTVPPLCGYKVTNILTNTDNEKQYLASAR